MSAWQRRYFNRFYGQVPGYRGNMEIFYSLVEKYANEKSRVLEIGPGSTNERSKRLASLCGSLVGLDIDEAVKQNEALAEAHVYDGYVFPLPDSHFDAGVSIWVNEHIEHPEIHCREIYRVLKPGGRYIFNTPNKYHYASMIACFTPHWFHVLVANRVRNLPKTHHEPHPTFYRFNSRKQCRLLLGQAGLEMEILMLTEMSPYYLRFSRIAYLAGVAYERVVNSTNLLENLRRNILCVARKV